MQDSIASPQLDLPTRWTLPIAESKRNVPVVLKTFSLALTNDNGTAKPTLLAAILCQTG